MSRGSSGKEELELDDILRQIREIQVSRENLESQERRLLDRATQIRTRRFDQPSRSATTSGRVSPTSEQRRFDQSVRPTTASSRVSPVSKPDETQQPHPSVGEHVYITNRIRHVPSARTTSALDRAAIVTGYLGSRIYFRTYNGDETWRESQNLRLLSTDEKQNLTRIRQEHHEQRNARTC